MKTNPTHQWGRLVLAALFLAFCYTRVPAAETPKKMLVVTVTKGFRHSSIATAEKVLSQIAGKSGAFAVDYVRNDTEMAEKMTPEALKNYDGFIFANTTGILPLPDKTAFLEAVKSGKAFIGMHSASDTFRLKDGVDPYIDMLGGEFLTHGAQAGVECLVQDRNHRATRHLGESYCIEKEEIYLLKNYDPARVHELLVLDKHPNNKKQSGHFPIAWTREYGQGKVFYTSLGHNEVVWENTLYQKHILEGISWTLGLPDTTRSRTTANAIGFKPLFNGKDLTGWKLRRPDGHNSWSVKDGVLVNTVNQGEHGTDLVTEDKFWNFTVRYEYKIPPGANSGFYLRGRHEIQIFDDFDRGKPSLDGNGAIYQHTAPSKFASKKPGEWQTVEATIMGNKITVVLNGEKIHDNVECLKATGSEIDAKINEPGPIFLQGDHGSVSFRNIAIKTLN